VPRSPEGNWTFRPFFSSPLDVSPPRRIQSFLLIQLKPEHHRLDVLATQVTVTVCVCHDELRATYLLTYLPGTKRLSGKRLVGKLTKGRNVHKSNWIYGRFAPSSVLPLDVSPTRCRPITCRLVLGFYLNKQETLNTFSRRTDEGVKGPVSAEWYLEDDDYCQLSDEAVTVAPGRRECDQERVGDDSDDVDELQYGVPHS